MLATGVVWIWSLILTYFSDPLSRVAPSILLVVSYALYFVGEAAASYLVCSRASSGYLLVGLRLAILSGVFSLLLASPANLTTTVVLLVCFAIGGAAGAYLALRKSLTPDS